MLSDHFQYLVQRPLHVLLLEILGQCPKVDGTICSPSMCPEMKQSYKKYLVYQCHTDIYFVKTTTGYIKKTLDVLGLFSRLVSISKPGAWKFWNSPTSQEEVHGKSYKSPNWLNASNCAISCNNKKPRNTKKPILPGTFLYVDSYYAPIYWSIT